MKMQTRITKPDRAAQKRILRSAAQQALATLTATDSPSAATLTFVEVCQAHPDTENHPCIWQAQQLSRWGATRREMQSFLSRMLPA